MNQFLSKALLRYQLEIRAQFQKACTHKQIAEHEISYLIKNRNTNEISICCTLLVYWLFGCCLLILKITWKFGW